MHNLQCRSYYMQYQPCTSYLQYCMHHMHLYPIKDTLGPAILSTVERLSSSQRLKMNSCYGKGAQNCVLCWEVVPISEGPLSEIPL